MEDNKQNTQSVITPNADNNEEKGGKTFSQEEVNKLVGSTRVEEKQKSEQAIKDAVANAIAEYERKAKLTEEEREKEANTKREAELKSREESVTLRERKIEAKELLASKNIPTELVEFVIDLDDKVMNANIEKLTKTYNTSVENGIADKLKGNPPKDFSNSGNDSTKTKATGTVAF